MKENRWLFCLAFRNRVLLGEKAAANKNRQFILTSMLEAESLGDSVEILSKIWVTTPSLIWIHIIFQQILIRRMNNWLVTSNVCLISRDNDKHKANEWPYRIWKPSSWCSRWCNEHRINRLLFPTSIFSSVSFPNMLLESLNTKVVLIFAKRWMSKDRMWRWWKVMEYEYDVYMSLSSFENLPFRNRRKSQYTGLDIVESVQWHSLTLLGSTHYIAPLSPLVQAVVLVCIR
jgi:hypothetical protein